MRILLPTKTGPSPVATSWLNALAERAPIELELVSVGSDLRLAPADGVIDLRIQLSSKICAGDPGKEILAEASRFQAGLIALSTRGLRGIVASMRHSVSHELVEGADVPLAMFGPHCPEAKSLSNLVVALDGSAYASRSVSAMAAIARELRLGVLLLQVFDPDDATLEPVLGGGKREFVEDSYLKGVRRELHGVDVQWEITHGDPAHAICEFAETVDGAAIVMTSHGHAGWRRKLVGSVTEGVVARAEAPVVVIPPRWRAEPDQ